MRESFAGLAERRITVLLGSGMLDDSPIRELAHRSARFQAYREFGNACCAAWDHRWT